ncbi:MAG: IS1634 family transposase [Gemmatimonadales bacterium]|nr:IS1634 family transposase [Gemmatimonadales bacterium]
MRKRKPSRVNRSRKRKPTGRQARVGRQTLRSEKIGALPILNHFIERLRLEQWLQECLPLEDKRVKVPAAKALLVLLRNLLISREPLYGMGEWAAGYAPDLLGLTRDELEALSDDGVGRALNCLFRSEPGAFVLAVVRHTIRQFKVTLGQLHNDSTTITFHGNYSEAAEEDTRGGQRTLAITWGHNKDHRPDLKQLVYILTISDDGGVPVHFRATSGNTTDDQTHVETWKLLCELAGRSDFLYVADSKLATAENMAYLHQHGGRFITVLPRTRGEDKAFRQSLREGKVSWRTIYEKVDEEDDQKKVLDRFSTTNEPTTSAEGYRLLWYHSTRKAELDALARANRIQRATRELDELRQRLGSPRTRYRQRDKVTMAVEEILKSRETKDLITVAIEERVEERYRQERRGRPTKDTRYVKQISTRFDLSYQIDHARIAEDQRCDGVFPLVTNVLELSEKELLLVYKRQPVIEKRFSQLKTDFRVAPVYLKDVSRIQALLCAYFLVLLVESLLERELRQAMEREGLESLPLYPENRPCRRPTARRVIDLFDDIQRHTLRSDDEAPAVFVTELSALQRRILKLLGVPATKYQA